MTEPFTRDDLEAYHEQREHQEQKQRAQEREQIQKQHARRQWLDGNGDPDVFERQWPEIWQQLEDERQKLAAMGETERDKAMREQSRRNPANRL